jgi:hypothetical protein
MPEAPREFKPLKDVGALPLNDTSELKFYVDEFKGYKYASIRTFVKGEQYSGPTKSGVTMNPAILADVIETLGKLPPEPAALEERELGRYPKKLGTELVVRITIYKDAAGIDIREWVDDQTYKGWSKKGIRILYKDLAKAVGFLREMQPVVGPPRAKP